MTAVIRAARGGLGGRRLQAVIIGLVALVSTAAATLSVGMLVDAHSPFDHAFASQHGAHVTATVDTSVATPTQLALPGLLATRHRYQDRVRQRLGANLEALGEWRRARPEVDWLAGSAGWSAVLKLPAARGTGWEHALLDRDVIVHPGHFYGIEASDALVLSLITDVAVFRDGLARIGGALDER